MHYRLNRRFIPWLIAHSFEYWYFYIGALFSLYMLHHFSSEIPLLAKNLGDMAMGGRLSEINIYEFFLLALYIIFFRTFSRLLFFYPARIQQRNLRMELVHRIENSYPRNYKKYNEGMLFQTLYNDLNRLRGFVGFALLQFGNIIIAALIFIPKIEAQNEKFMIAFSPLIGCVFFFSILIYVFQPYMRRGMDEYADVQNFLLESYEAKKTIQNYHAEKDFLKYFNQKSNKELRTLFIATMGRSFSFPLLKVGVGASLIWGALIVKNNDLPASDLIFFSSFLFLVLEPIMFISWIGVVTSQGYAGWTRVKELVNDLSQKIEDGFFSKNNVHTCPTLPLWDKDISVNIPEGKWTVLVGETGCGKSWILERYAELLHMQGLKYSFIHQEPYLYNDTVENNIFLGQEKTPEKIILAKHYLKEFDLDVLSSSLESLLKLELGENGKRVSGGQAKRISLIRSLVSDVDFIIWDDPFSSVDLILESKIINKLKSDKNLAHRTFIVSSHRISTVRACDYIVLLEKVQGVVVQDERDVLLNKET
ncbi:MAG: ABC transporter ATP-binding protein/permease, partial [Flavobacteriaceae bacterium]|nr:ABC transporter ATP-binding protein/permease [Flavobacteriaceae bacterium]